MAKQSAETVETSQGNEHSGTQIPSSMDSVPTTSLDKEKWNSVSINSLDKKNKKLKQKASKKKWGTLKQLVTMGVTIH